jgi:hypothetical protein
VRLLKTLCKVFFLGNFSQFISNQPHNSVYGILSELICLDLGIEIVVEGEFEFVVKIEIVDCQ